MGALRLQHARLKTTFGMPCRRPGGERTAVWHHDDIVILRRIGSHYLCYVAGSDEQLVYGHQMLVWLHKRAVRIVASGAQSLVTEE